ncbi:3-hydroxyacyl-ACP dehydratase [Flammeovirga aprica]|uniref:3-hydroxyacyl-ACP dehydratase n=1 Tax=Flammeovirga aprica JL-4 TaxID=694437 RepID=A0A7X9NZ06_9BACT|nr:3-hydroxyacyl-ACP dehydratase [Flammeovirga aprica]NME66519.1 3-hydroxyacyl-ACP dehydratase [Flammeovirga aprica JL-4]
MGTDNTMIATAETIEQYIPQRAPFIMVDNLLEADEKVTVTSKEVKEDMLFVRKGKLQTAALVENIAQTAAAGVGYRCAQAEKDVPLGFIGGIKGFQLQKHPLVGETITTTVTVKNEVFGASIVEGVITINEEVIASAELKIFIEQDEA